MPPPPSSPPALPPPPGNRVSQGPLVVSRLRRSRRRSRRCHGDGAEAEGEPLRRGRRDLRLRQAGPRRLQRRRRHRGGGQPVCQPVERAALHGTVLRDPREAPHAPRVAAEGGVPPLSPRQPDPHPRR